MVHGHGYREFKLKPPTYTTITLTFQSSPHGRRAPGIFWFRQYKAFDSIVATRGSRDVTPSETLHARTDCGTRGRGCSIETTSNKTWDEKISDTRHKIRHIEPETRLHRYSRIIHHSTAVLLYRIIHTFTLTYCNIPQHYLDVRIKRRKSHRAHTHEHTYTHPLSPPLPFPSTTFTLLTNDKTKPGAEL